MTGSQPSTVMVSELRSAATALGRDVAELRSELARGGNARRPINITGLADALKARLADELRSFQRAAVETLVGVVIAPDAMEYAEMLERLERGELPEGSCGHTDNAAGDEPQDTGDEPERERGAKPRGHRGKRGGRRHHRQQME